MKIKLSVSIDEEILNRIDKLIEQKIFRNRSHAVDFVIFRGGKNR